MKIKTIFQGILRDERSYLVISYSLHSTLSLLLLASSPESQTQAELLKLLGRFTFEKQKEGLVNAYR